MLFLKNRKFFHVALTICALTASVQASEKPGPDEIQHDAGRRVNVINQRESDFENHNNQKTNPPSCIHKDVWPMILDKILATATLGEILNIRATNLYFRDEIDERLPSEFSGYVAYLHKGEEVFSSNSERKERFLLELRDDPELLQSILSSDSPEEQIAFLQRYRSSLEKRVGKGKYNSSKENKN